METEGNPTMLGRLRARLAYYGLAALCLRGVAMLLQKLSRQRLRLVPYHFFAQPISDAPNLSASRTSTITIEQAGPTHGLAAHFPRPGPVIAQRFENGAVCFVARKSDRFAGFLWLQTGEYAEDEVRCLYLLQPPDLAAWDFDVYVEPAFRFGTTFVRLWDAAHAHLRGAGFRWTLSRISVFNRESIRAHLRLGAVRVCSGVFIAGKRWQLGLFTVAPFLHIGGPHNVPRLRLAAPLRNHNNRIGSTARG